MDRKDIRKNIIGAIVGAVLAYYVATHDIRHLLPALDPALAGHWIYLRLAGAGWVGMSIYWEIAAKTAAAAKSQESSFSRGIHVFLVNFTILLVFLPVRGLGRFLPASPAIMAAGLAIEAVGLALAIWARVYLGRNWSGAIAIKVEHQLIRSGPYRWLRHPIYTGLLLMYVGPAMITGEWHSLIGVGLAGFAYWRKIRLEESALDAAFGAEYEEYRQDSWALVPGGVNYLCRLCPSGRVAHDPTGLILAERPQPSKLCANLRVEAPCGSPRSSRSSLLRAACRYTLSSFAKSLFLLGLARAGLPSPI
jgi:protein-S-isoprenylcysteine O-methyltransferase Ste14